MKKLIFIVLATMMALTAEAQVKAGVASMAKSLKSVQLRGMQFGGRSGETFVVYVDGVPYNEQPQYRLQVSDLKPGKHDIAVRLVSPADRMVHFELDEADQQGVYTVNYDAQQGVLTVYFPGNNRSNGSRGHDMVVHRLMPPTPPAMAHASDDDVSRLLGVLEGTSFDSDKLSVAKSFVSSKKVLAQQVVSIAEKFRMDSSKLDFMIYAYDYCVDKDNYYLCTEVLTFSSSKSELLEAVKKK